MLRHHVLSKMHLPEFNYFESLNKNTTTVLRIKLIILKLMIEWSISWSISQSQSVISLFDWLTDGRIDEWTDGRTDGLIEFKYHFILSPWRDWVQSSYQSISIYMYSDVFNHRWFDFLTGHKMNVDIYNVLTLFDLLFLTFLPAWRRWGCFLDQT